ncbi:MAG: S9 family peptidase [Hyphomonadaceae bacterium]|nr:MAG: prolyl oligopeptidase [Caulobacteraceae bacterium]MBT9445249.1 S9 family peptidase [Hyphomonadaceae bacterium]TPW07950.1 MAG: prolyl oligopeptidase [Alphaproteobacteria bacterium]
MRSLISVLLIAFGLTASSLAQVAVRPTAEQFAADASFHAASLSPSGRYLAGIKQDGDYDALVVIDLTTRQMSTIQRANEATGVRLGWVDWKTDDRLVFGALYKVVLQTRTRTGSRINQEEAEEDIWIPRVVSTARTGGAVVSVFEGHSNRLAVRIAPTLLVDRLQRDPDHILLSAYSPTGLALWKANVLTGQVSKVDQGGFQTAGWITDSTGAQVMRFEALPRRTGFRYFRRGPGSREWVQFLELKRAEAANSTIFTPLGAAPEPGKVYVAARPEGQDRASIYAFDTATGEYGAPLLGHPVADLDVPIIDQANHQLLGACADVQRIECVGATPAITRHLRAIDRFFGQSAHFMIAEVSQDQKTWLLAVEEPASPMAYYVYQRDAASITPITRTRNSLADVALAATKVISYKSRDGTDLWGVVTNPPAAGAPPKALIVMPHGGPEARDGSGFDTWAQFLASRGYVVFQPNFRGGSGFGRAFAEAGYRQWGRRMQDDITDGVKHLADTHVIDPARVCIFGWSYGGYAALAGGALTPDLYKCVIAGAGPSDLLEMLSYERVEEGRGSAGYSYWVRIIGDPSADRDALIAASPRRQARAFTAPVLLLHGDDDDIVPVEQSRIMRDALVEAGKSVKLVELKEENHHLEKYANRVIFYREIDAFLAQHLPAN